MWSTSSPNTLRSALISATSPCGVDVAWAFTCTTSAGFRSVLSSRFCSACAMPLPDGSGCVMWWASAEMPWPTASA